MKRSLIFGNNQNVEIRLDQIKKIIPYGTEIVDNIMIEPLHLSWNNRVAEEITGGYNYQNGCIITTLFDNSRYYLFYGSRNRFDLPSQVTIGKEINGTLFLISESSLMPNSFNDDIITFTRRTFMVIAPEDIYCENIMAYDITEFSKVQRQYKQNIAHIVGSTIYAFNYYLKAKLRFQEKTAMQRKIENFKVAPQEEKGERICLKA